METSAHQNKKQRKDTGAQTQNRTQNLIRFKLVPKHREKSLKQSITKSKQHAITVN